MAITNGFPKDEKQVVDSALSTTSTNPVQNAIVTQNLNNKANTSSVLTKTNTTAFTPTADIILLLRLMLIAKQVVALIKS